MEMWSNISLVANYTLYRVAQTCMSASAQTMLENALMHGVAG